MTRTRTAPKEPATPPEPAADPRAEEIERQRESATATHAELVTTLNALPDRVRVAARAGKVDEVR